MTSGSEPVRVWGIIPAAGMSRRMGSPKQVLPFKGSTMTGAVAGTLFDAGLDGIVVVTRTELAGSLGLPSDDRLWVAFNDDDRSEMIDSVRIGLAALDDQASRGGGRLSDSDGVMVMPADMPSVRAASCRSCVAAFREDPVRIVIATCEGERGHPIIFPVGLRPVVETTTTGLRALTQEHVSRLHLVETGDPGAVRDADTPADYEDLRGGGS